MKVVDFRYGRITILGGTGTLGQALTRSIQETWPQVQVTIFSRDEHKQALMKRNFPRCRYIVGDIRDPNSARWAMKHTDVVFHVAALKHVDILESCPMQSIYTNTLSTKYLADLATSEGVQHFVFSSTDKAVDPINTYGYSKALSEKILWQYNREQTQTKFSVYRWGNVLGSQGSIIPVFIDTLMRERTAYITDTRMTRYWLPIQWAVTYMLRTFGDAKSQEAMIPPNMKAAPVIDVIDALADLLGIEEPRIMKIPIRPGEKLHEAMTSQHSDEYLNSETAPRFTRQELCDMLLPFVEAAKKAKAA